MLWHVSRTSGLKTLKPMVSTHGRAYVYAVDNLTTGLLFGAETDDFDFIINTSDEGAPEIFECYQNAFESVYKGKSCSVYELDDSGFMRGMTSWSAELVSVNEVKALNETVVPDLYDRLLEEEKGGRLIINRFSRDAEYKRLISGHIVDRLIRFNIGNDVKDERLLKHYKKLIDGISSLTDGHLL